MKCSDRESLIQQTIELLTRILVLMAVSRLALSGTVRREVAPAACHIRVASATPSAPSACSRGTPPSYKRTSSPLRPSFRPLSRPVTLRMDVFRDSCPLTSTPMPCGKGSTQMLTASVTVRSTRNDLFQLAELSRQPVLAYRIPRDGNRKSPAHMNALAVAALVFVIYDGPCPNNICPVSSIRWFCSPSRHAVYYDANGSNLNALWASNQASFIAKQVTLDKQARTLPRASHVAGQCMSAKCSLRTRNSRPSN